MRNTPATLELIARRCIHDFNEAPVGLRKAAGPERMTELQVLCRSFTLMLEIFQSAVPDSVYQAEVNELHNKFLMGFLDSPLEQEVNVAAANDGKLDIENLPALRMILKRINAESEKASLVKSRELRDKFHAASFEEINNRLETDLVQLAKYYDELKKRTKNWSDAELEFRRKAYRAGLAACQDRMQTHVHFFHVPDISTAIADFSAWRHACSQIQTGPPNDSPSCCCCCCCCCCSCCCCCCCCCGCCCCWCWW